LLSYHIKILNNLLISGIFLKFLILHTPVFKWSNDWILIILSLLEPSWWDKSNDINFIFLKSILIKLKFLVYRMLIILVIFESYLTILNMIGKFIYLYIKSKILLKNPLCSLNKLAKRIKIHFRIFKFIPILVYKKTYLII
jgi:hypothetical protein